MIPKEDYAKWAVASAVRSSNPTVQSAFKSLLLAVMMAHGDDINTMILAEIALNGRRFGYEKK